jgi:DNA-binding NtrC family response regulator
MATYMLLAGGDAAARNYVEEAAGKLGFACRVIGRGAALGAALEQPSGGRLALIVLDLDTPDLDAAGILRQVRDVEAAPIVVLSSDPSAPLAKQMMREGACDNLIKPLSAERVEIAMRNALKISVLEEEVARLKRQAEGKLAWSDIIAVSPEMQRVLSLAKRAADLEIPVLIEGERGAGRELIAKAIHAASNRASARFITLDVRENTAQGRGGQGDMLLEALWAEAEGGTLFVKEIGELGGADQQRLADLLTRRRASGDGASTPPSARLICSSSLDLIAQVKTRQVREDLFYLINVFPIWIPPLRDRPDDLAHLVWHSLTRFAAEEGKRIQSIHPDALALLKSYAWPGNVRQLENVIYRAVILAEGDQLRVDELPQIAAQVRGFVVPVPPVPAPRFKEPYRGPAMYGSPLSVTSPTPYMPPSAPLGIPVLTDEGEIRSLTEIEADLIRLALGHYRGHITEAARRLGIGRSTLYRKMREFGLDMRHNSV